MLTTDRFYAGHLEHALIHEVADEVHALGVEGGLLAVNVESAPLPTREKEIPFLIG